MCAPCTTLRPVSSGGSGLTATAITGWRVRPTQWSNPAGNTLSVWPEETTTRVLGRTKAHLSLATVTFLSENSRLTITLGPAKDVTLGATTTRSDGTRSRTRTAIGMTTIAGLHDDALTESAVTSIGPNMTDGAGTALMGVFQQRHRECEGYGGII